MKNRSYRVNPTYRSCFSREHEGYVGNEGFLYPSGYIESALGLDTQANALYD